MTFVCIPLTVSLSSGQMTAALAGGVVSGLLGLLLIIMLVVIVMAILSKRFAPSAKYEGAIAMHSYTF